MQRLRAPLARRKKKLLLIGVIRLKERAKTIGEIAIETSFKEGIKKVKKLLNNIYTLLYINIIVKTI